MSKDPRSFLTGPLPVNTDRFPHIAVHLRLLRPLCHPSNLPSALLLAPPGSTENDDFIIFFAQNPDIVLVHYLNVPYPDDNKMLVTNSVSLWGEKKEWTKEELISQLKPMCKYQN